MKNLGIVYVSKEFFSKLLCEGNSWFKPVHGITEFEIVTARYDCTTGLFTLIVCGPMVDSYIGYHKIMGDLELEEEVPVIELIFDDVPCREKTGEEFQDGEWPSSY